jgi:hypothetical protein
MMMMRDVMKSQLKNWQHDAVDDSQAEMQSVVSLKREDTAW